MPRISQELAAARAELVAAHADADALRAALAETYQLVRGINWSTDEGCHQAAQASALIQRIVHVEATRYGSLRRYDLMELLRPELKGVA